MKTKSILLVLLCLCLSLTVSAQDAQNLKVFDTRTTANQSPTSFLPYYFRADYKMRSTLNLPDSEKTLSNNAGTLTLKPGTSSDWTYQLGFSGNAIFFRSGTSNWREWSELATLSENCFRQSQWLSKNGMYGQTPIGDSSVRLYFGGASDNTDQISMYRYNNQDNRSDLRIQIGDDNQGDDRLVVGSFKSESFWNPFFTVVNDGRVGIGIADPENALDVNGIVRATELLILSPVGDSSGRLNFGTRIDNTDPVSIYRQNVDYDRTDLRIEIGDNDFGDDRFVVGSTINGFKPLFVVQNDAKVGIGVENPQNALDVNGIIRAKEILVETGWADFVFSKDYVLPSLDEVKNHIEEHKHLPGIPSESEVKENGVGLSEMTTKMMQKIEELTLYTIQQNDMLKEHQRINEELIKRIQELENSKK